MKAQALKQQNNEEWNVEMTQLVLYSYLMDMGALHVSLIYLSDF